MTSKATKHNNKKINNLHVNQLPSNILKLSNN